MRINTSKISGKIKVRILRAWRGFPVGTVIVPVGALRAMLLQEKGPLGEQIAEVVEDAAAPAEVTPEVTPEVAPVKRGPGRPPKGRE